MRHGSTDWIHFPDREYAGIPEPEGIWRVQCGKPAIGLEYLVDVCDFTGAACKHCGTDTAHGDEITISGRTGRSRVSADAEGRELQPRSRQGADREGHAVARWQVECAVGGRSALGRPFSRPVLGNVSSCQVSDMVGLADDVRLRG